MTIAQLAAYLNVSEGGLYHMLPKITHADGKIRIGRVWRFHRDQVLDRVKAGLFCRGLDEDGNPVKNGKPVKNGETP